MDESGFCGCDDDEEDRVGEYGVEYGYGYGYEYTHVGQPKKGMKGSRQGGQVGGTDLKHIILADFPGDHPVLKALRAISKLSHAAFLAIWLAVVLVNSILGLIARGTVVAVEVVCAMLDWVGADY
ncbi:hypothetical protein V8F33_008100 [Rhypophila sp. PSN 637]